MRKSAFTLIELMVVIAIIGILGVSFAPVIGDAVMKAKVAKTIEIINTLETAAEMFHNDTGSYAYEYAGSGVSGSHLEQFHQLAYNPGIANWAGPYLKQPLGVSQNVWSGSGIYLYNSTSCWAIDNIGFDLNGDGTVEKTGGPNTGNCLVIPAIPEKYAKMINDKYDTGVAGDWKVTGRVRYAYGYHLIVYLGGGE